jgi:hypothetical protein
MTTYATAVCPECGERFSRGRYGNRFQRSDTPLHERGRYCKPSCRQAAYRRRKAIRNDVPHSQRNAPRSVTPDGEGTDVRRSVTTLEIQQRFQEALPPEKESLGTVWRWYERLDGSSDLYCDELGVGSRHVARIVRDGAGFRMAKPGDLTAETRVWTHSLIQ